MEELSLDRLVKPLICHRLKHVSLQRPASAETTTVLINKSQANHEAGANRGSENRPPRNGCRTTRTGSHGFANASHYFAFSRSDACQEVCALLEPRCTTSLGNTHRTNPTISHNNVSLLCATKKSRAQLPTLARLFLVARYLPRVFIYIPHVCVDRVPRGPP